jgi:isopentenyl-diphosphate Delta-isomerase
VDIAKAIALGADIGATAKPALGPANAGEGAQGVIEELRAYIDELRVAMFCSGCTDLPALRALKLVRSG